MLNAVWVAVIIAAACWAVLVAAAVWVLIKLSRLITQTSVTVSALRENTDYGHRPGARHDRRHRRAAGPDR